MYLLDTNRGGSVGLEDTAGSGQPGEPYVMDDGAGLYNEVITFAKTIMRFLPVLL
jgi:hypothetical protein